MVRFWPKKSRFPTLVWKMVRFFIRTLRRSFPGSSYSAYLFTPVPVFTTTHICLCYKWEIFAPLHTQQNLSMSCNVGKIDSYLVQAEIFLPKPAFNKYSSDFMWKTATHFPSGAMRSIFSATICVTTIRDKVSLSETLIRTGEIVHRLLRRRKYLYMAQLEAVSVYVGSVQLEDKGTGNGLVMIR